MGRRVDGPRSRQFLARERTRIADEPYVGRQTGRLPDPRPGCERGCGARPAALAFAGVGRAIRTEKRRAAGGRAVEASCYRQRGPVSEQTLDAPALEEVPPGPPGDERRATDRTDWRELAYRYRWLLTAAGLLIVSLLLLLYARTRPGYDPYGWLVWGKLTIHLNLDTNGAPSWKPMPYLFTVPYAVFGRYALWLWM